MLVAAGDVNGDGRADVICGTGPGGAPRVLAFDGLTFKVLHDFYAFDEADRGGVSIGSGDVNGDGAADLIVGSGVGEAPQVRVFSGPDLTPLADFQVPWLSGGKSAGGGVHVAATDLDGDGVSDVLVGQAAGASPVVTGYKVVPSGTQPVELGQDTPFGTDDTGGIYVGGS